MSAAAASAQGQLRSHQGLIGAKDLFGTEVTGLPDVNNDGIPDYAVSGPGVSTGGNSGGTVVAFSGATGAQLWTALGSGGWVPCVGGGTNGDFLGAAMVLIPDADGDGFDDLAVSSPNYGVTSGGCRDPFYGRLTVHSSVTGNVIPGRTRTGTAPIKYGIMLERMSDMDSDGVDEYAASNGATLDIINGATGMLMSGVPIPAGTSAFAPAGDFDEDGLPWEVAFGNMTTGTVEVIDTILPFKKWTYTGPSSSAYGQVLTFVPGANGVANTILVGAPNDGPSANGGVYSITFDGGSTQLSTGDPGDMLGGSFAYGGNADLDLLNDDVLVGAVGGNYVRIIDLDGNQLRQATVPNSSKFGASVAWVGDTSSSGFTEFIVGDPEFMALQGRATVFIGGPDATLNQNYGSGCSPSGMVSTLTMDFGLRIGQPSAATLTGAPAGVPTTLYFGQASTTGIIIGQCTIWMNPQFGPIALTSALTGANGSYVFPAVTVPMDPQIIGLEFTHQALVIEAGQLALSNAVSSVVGW